MADPNFEKMQKLLVFELGLDEDEITPQAKLYDDLGMDSLDLVEVTLAIEDAFDIEIEDVDAEGWRTVQDLLNQVK